MAFAFFSMCKWKNANQKHIIPSSRAYAEARESYSLYMSKIMTDYWSQKTLEERSAYGKFMNECATFEQRSTRSKLMYEKISKEQRSKVAKKTNDTLGPEGRSARAKKSMDF